MPVISIVPIADVIQYDGSNGEEVMIASAVTYPYTDEDGVLTIDGNPADGTIVLDTGDWLIVPGVGKLTNADYESRYIPLADLQNE